MMNKCLEATISKSLRKARYKTSQHKNGKS